MLPFRGHRKECDACRERKKSITTRSWLDPGLPGAGLANGNPQSDDSFSEHKPPFELKYRNRAAEMIRKTRPVQSVFDVCNEYTADWFVNDLEEPYTTPKDQPFFWMGALRRTAR